MKFIVAIIIFALVAIGAYFGYEKYEHNQLIAAITPHVKNASIRVQNSTRYELEPETKATFKEIFEKLESDIVEIDKHLIEVQTLTNAKTLLVAEPAVAYLKSSQEYLRALLQKYRRMLRHSSASDRSTEAIAEIRTSGQYGWEAASKRADKAIEELRQAQIALSEARPELAQAASKLVEQSAALQSTLAADSLVPIAQLKSIAEKNSPEPASPASSPK